MERRPFSAAVLAGGKNSRMKIHKAFLEVGGRPMIARILEELAAHFEEVLIVANEPEKYATLGFPVYRDLIPGRGPLSGIHAALTYAAYDHTFIVACDMPFVNGRLARQVTEKAWGYDCAVPKAGKHPEPLFAAYARSCLPVIEDCLAAGRLKVMDLFARVRVNYVEEDFAGLAQPGDIFFNVNHPGDLARAELIARPNGVWPPEHPVPGMPPLVCVVGSSDSGKTRLVAGLVRVLKERGYRVGTVKHCPHGADLDVSGKDSWQHARAGAEVSAIATPGGLALFRELPAEPSLEEIASHFQGLDLVIVEGYKHLGYPKILVRSEKNWPGNPRGLFALVGSGLPELDLPVYDPDDVAGLADMITVRFGLR